MPDIPFVCGRYIPGHEKIIELLIGACNCTYTRSAAYFLSAADAREETCRRKLIAPAGLLIGVEIVFIGANISDIEFAQVDQRYDRFFLPKHFYHISLLFAEHRKGKRLFPMYNVGNLNFVSA